MVVCEIAGNCGPTFLLGHGVAIFGAARVG